MQHTDPGIEVCTIEIISEDDYDDVSGDDNSGSENHPTSVQTHQSDLPGAPPSKPKLNLNLVGLCVDHASAESINADREFHQPRITSSITNDDEHFRPTLSGTSSNTESDAEYVITNPSLILEADSGAEVDHGKTFILRPHSFESQGFKIDTEGKFVSPFSLAEAAALASPGKMCLNRDAAHSTPEILVLKSAHLRELGVLGRGQNGAVHKALHIPSLIFVALKSMSVHDKNTRHQLIKELTAYSRLSSPYIVSFLGAFYDAGRIVLASEYMNCGSLQSFVERHGSPLPESVLKHIVREVVLGLDYLHRNHQVHRDIKPENILLNHHGSVKIGDFGLLKDLGGTKAVTRSFMGTMAYLSPERITSRSYSYVSDIWSFGVSILYCCLGENPFFSTDYWELIDRIDRAPAPTLDPKRFSPELCDFVAKCLIKNPDERPSASQLLSEPFLRDVPDTSHMKEWTVRVGEIEMRQIIDDVCSTHFKIVDADIIDPLSSNQYRHISKVTGSFSSAFLPHTLHVAARSVPARVFFA